MDIDIIFKGNPSNNIFPKCEYDSKKYHLAPTDSHTYKYVLDNIKQSCKDGIEGIIIKVRGYKYIDAKQLWASVDIDKILSILSPGGCNAMNWLSDTLDIIGNDSTQIIQATSNMGIYVDEYDMALVIDKWKHHKIESKEDYEAICDVIEAAIIDNNVTSINDAMDIIRQYNKLSNSIITEFSGASIQGVIDIAKKMFDCKINMMIDTEDIEDEQYVGLTKPIKEKIWRFLVHNRGKVESVSFNIDTECGDIEIFKVKRYKDSKKRLKFENIVIYDCNIEDSIIEDCIMYKSSFTRCIFKNCKTLGVRVKIKDCKNYKDEIEGIYIIDK